MVGVANSNAQVYVKKPLPVPKTKVAPRTSKYQVWVPGDWEIGPNDKYVYRAGYWGYPVTNKVVYKPGRWEKSDKGYSHRPGSWVLQR